MSPSGGTRDGAGRPQLHAEKKINTSIKITPTLQRYLNELGPSQSEAIEQSIRKTKAFRDWLKSQPDA
jgi:hypothetical protein